jgi:hypothetical protein
VKRFDAHFYPQPPCDGQKLVEQALYPQASQFSARGPSRTRATPLGQGRLGTPEFLR